MVTTRTLLAPAKKALIGCAGNERLELAVKRSGLAAEVCRLGFGCSENGRWLTEMSAKENNLNSLVTALERTTSIRVGTVSRYAVGLLAAALLFGATACGKKGAPQPPEFFAPAAVDFFQASGSVDGILLQWQEPTAKRNGDGLNDLAGFVVQRRVFDGDSSESWEELSSIEAIPDVVPDEGAAPAQTSGSKVPKAFSLGGAQGGGSEASKLPKQYSYLDTKVKAGRKYEYFVVAQNTRGVDGVRGTVIRVTFVGESSIIERR